MYRLQQTIRIIVLILMSWIKSAFKVFSMIIVDTKIILLWINALMLI